MNWEAIGAVGEILGALVVAGTLGYLAVQTRNAKQATTDANRINRSNGVVEMIKTMAINDDARNSFEKVESQFGSAHDQTAEKFGISHDDASRAHWTIVYYFWLHWGQFASANDEASLEELRHLIDVWYRSPGIRHQWNTSPIVKPIIDRRFVDFVDGILNGGPTD
jgi:hypothetical protein